MSDIIALNGPDSPLEICRAEINKDTLTATLSIAMDPKQMNSMKIFGSDGKSGSIWWEESIKDTCRNMAVCMIEAVRERREKK